MNELLSTVDWSRAQFALTACVHWLFVPLSIGLALIVGIMETIWFRTRDERWKRLTKFWMLLFGINFACGVATGIIMEFEFGTNWSNYSWFVGDIFGAPLAIEGIAAFFLESTFIAVMFFGWKRVSPAFHLAATWLTALGICLSAYWILVANAWMQNPVGTEFSAAEMRNVMTSFTDVALSSSAVAKFLHTVSQGWVLGGVFVVGVSAWFLLRKSNVQFAKDSMKIASWVGLAGILLTLWTGDMSAVDVARTQPMKLAAMEGLYNGHCGQDLMAVGIYDDTKDLNSDGEAVKYAIKIPKMLSVLANHDADSFVPGVNDILLGRTINSNGDTLYGASVAERIANGKIAQQDLREYEAARAKGDTVMMAETQARLNERFSDFGYGFLESPEQAVPPVGITFYAFHIMVIFGGYLLLFFVVMIFLSYKSPRVLENGWLIFFSLISIPVVWICSEAGWVVAEVGRQPWTIQGLLPCNAAISSLEPGGVITTFWMFVVVFIGLIAADISILIHEIKKASRRDILAGTDEVKPADNYTDNQTITD